MQSSLIWRFESLTALIFHLGPVDTYCSRWHPWSIAGFWCVPRVSKSRRNHMVFILQGLLIFMKSAGNKIICVWGNAQISDNKCSQLTRIIQSYWHNRFHVRSHTCQTQINRSFVIFFPGALALNSCHGEKKCPLIPLTHIHQDTRHFQNGWTSSLILYPSHSAT